MKNILMLVFAICMISAQVVPLEAWVAARGYGYHGAAVGPHGAAVWGPHGGAVVARPYGGCCYSGYSGWDVAGAAVAGAVVGAAVGAAVAKPAPPPVYIAPPVYGTVVYSLPGACTATMYGSVTYSNCNNVFYQPIYQGGTLVYQVVQPPY